MPMDLAAIRAGVTDALTGSVPDGVRVYSAPPARPAFPCVILTEADSEFVVPDPDHFGGYLVTWSAMLAVAPSPDNEQMTAAMDQLVSAVLDGASLLLPEIQTYATATLAGQAYLVATITLQTRID